MPIKILTVFVSSKHI